MAERFVITETVGVREVHALAGNGDYDTMCGFDPEGDPVSRLLGTSQQGKINCQGCAAIIRAVRLNYTLRDLDGSVVSGL